MVREVRVLAVEDKYWWMQPLFSFPFIGDLSARQLLITICFVVTSALLSISSGLGFGGTAVIVLVSGFIGLGVAKKPVKSTLPEKQLLVFLSGKYKPRIRRVPGKPKAVGKASQVPEALEVVARDSTRIPTIKIVGVLRDLLGNPLANQELEVYINNRLYSRIKTGSMGEYTVYYSPEGPGLYEVEIRLHGNIILKRRVKVGVRG